MTVISKSLLSSRRFFRKGFHIRRLSIRTLSTQNYSQAIPGEENIRISSQLGGINDLLRVKHSPEQTVYELFLRGLQTSKSGHCVGTRNKNTGKYEWMSFLETLSLGHSVGAGFQQLGIEPGSQTLIAINCKNRFEFVVSYLGTSAYSNVIVPLYDHLDSQAVNHIISLTETPMYIIDSEDKANYVLSQKALFPKLRVLVTMSEPSRDLRANGISKGVHIVSFPVVDALGRFTRKQLVLPKPDDLFAICWTSGSTGMPKGALINHKNLVSAADSALAAIRPFSFENRTVFSYMPTGHIYELLVQVQTFSHGGRLGFFSGDLLKLMDDVRALKPNTLPMVPRILNRLYLACLKEINESPVKRMLLPLALKQKEKQIRRRVVSRDSIWDKIIFKKTQELFGGNVELMTSSAAPLAPEVRRFFLCALGTHILNGYGQTETGPITISDLADFDGDNVGAPTPGCVVKLNDVPEMGYFAKDNIGEICVKGDGIISGYYKNQKANQETFDQQGWIHTGDVGMWLPNGTLKIVDRKKNLFKLSQGEYLSPEKVENVYVRLPLLQQVYVDGREDKDYLIAIVVPDPAAFIPWAKHKGFDKNKSDLDSLCQDKEIRKNIIEKLRKLGKESDLSSLEQIRNVYLRPNPFTIEGGHLTPTLKLRRNVLKKDFDSLILGLYAEGPLV